MLVGRIVVIFRVLIFHMGSANSRKRLVASNFVGRHLRRVIIMEDVFRMRIVRQGVGKGLIFTGVRAVKSSVVKRVINFASDKMVVFLRVVVINLVRRL